MRVALIPTGSMELRGLPPLLRRYFPEHSFTGIGKRWGNPHAPKAALDGFTSSRVTLPVALAGDLLPDLVQTCVALLQPGGGEVFDCAVVLEDLELTNRDQPGVVTAAFAAAVRQHLASVPPRTRAILAPILRQRCSFHLAAPMTESWFFGDPRGLHNASVPSARLPPLLKDGCLIEDFETDDPRYLADDGEGCEAWLAAPPRRRKRLVWLVDERQHHPKAYISWLCRNPRPTTCTSYSATSGGRRALARLDLASVLSEPGDFPFLRALVADLADILGGWPAGLPTGGSQSALTSIHHLPDEPVIRNL